MTSDEFLRDWNSILCDYSYSVQRSVGIFTLPTFNKFVGVKHGFSARIGGASTGEFASLNLSFSREEPRDKVMRNYRIFCDAAFINEESMVMDNYAHGTSVQLVDRRDAGRGYTRTPLPICDAMITNDPAITLITGHADCMALFFFDPVHRSIGLAHAGWRGALNRIGACVVSSLGKTFQTRPSELYVGIGPSICSHCFEVDLDVANTFSATFPDTPCVNMIDERKKATVDLWMVVFRQLIDAGVLADHISLMGVCTYEDRRLFSYRRDGGNTGGMAAFLALSSDDQ